MMTQIFGIVALVSIIAAGPAVGQSTEVKEGDDWCRQDDHWHDDYHRYCEVRELPLNDKREVIRVDAEPNGGITVHGWNKSTVLVRAKVVANAKSSERAKELAGRVSISTNGTIRAEGPRNRKRQWFSVSYEIFAPHNSNVDLETKNGGVTVTDLDGRVRFETVNGGVELAAVAGDVVGRTTNGGVSIELEGKSWNGRGLDVETVNGGVSIYVPEDYSAELETGTVNGHIEVDFPVPVEGKISRRLNATLGNGGKVIRAVTTNGGVVVTRG